MRFPWDFRSNREEIEWLQAEAERLRESWRLEAERGADRIQEVERLDEQWRAAEERAADYYAEVERLRAIVGGDDPILDENERLRAALDDIAHGSIGTSDSAMRDIARAALGEEEA